MSPHSPAWTSPPRRLTVPGREVHVWRFSLSQPTDRLFRLGQSLSGDEIERADRYRFQKHRHHFIVARGTLRHILARYLALEPGQISFCYSSYGKPDLVRELNPEGLRFNLSHAGELGLLAVAQGRAVGVDIEYFRPDLAGVEIARRFFSPAEISALLSLPDRLHCPAFFTCWTRKEAYIKAIGEGLSMPLDRFDVTLEPGSPALLLATRPDPGEASRWTLRHLAPGPGYAAALAVEGQVEEVQLWNWVFSE